MAQPTPAKPRPTENRPKILRIGVILGDKIVEERLVRDRGPVTIGQSAKNTFAVPSPELPRSWTLFQVDHKTNLYQLTVADSMDGRISEAGQVQTIAQLKASGRVAKQGQAWVVPLTEAARGKVVVGEMTLLFQFVQAPPVQPRPQLPHSVRGSLADRIDPYLAVIMSVSLVAHGLTWAYCKYIVEEPPPPPPDVIPDQFARVVIERPKPIQPKEELKKDDKATGAEKKADDKKARALEPKKEPAPVDRQSIEEKVASAAPLRVLNQLGARGNGPLGNLTGDKQAWEDLDKGLSKVGSGNVVASVGTTSGQTIRGAGNSDVATGKEVGVTGPTGPAATGGEKVEKEVKVQGRTESFQDIEAAGLDPDVVSKTIKSRYQGRVNACYQRALKTNPTLRGRVDLEFTVGPAGNVVKSNAKGFDGGVDDCINREARTWRFNKPEGPATFALTFVLDHRD
jgi:outer membrane biosynthesis protein TonB